MPSSGFQQAPGTHVSPRHTYSRDIHAGKVSIHIKLKKISKKERINSYNHLKQGLTYRELGCSNQVSKWLPWQLGELTGLREKNEKELEDDKVLFEIL